MWPSKTEVACDCNALARWTEDATIPVRFDARLNEYHFVYPTPQGEGTLILYHCPFCGGKAPPSLRASLFARIPGPECHRLAALTQPLQTVDEVIAALGVPDEDTPAGFMVVTLERDGKPSDVQAYRTLRYSRLSESANVTVTVSATGQAAFRFSGKYLGNKPLGKDAA